MRRLANGTQVAAKPLPAAAVGTPGFGTNGNPSAGVQASIFDADTFNIQQEEIAAVIEASGATLDPTGTNVTQLLVALRYLFGGTGIVGMPGYLRLQAGLVMQWGSGESAAGGITSVLFTSAFTNAPFIVLAAERNAVGWINGSDINPTVHACQSPNKNGFTMYSARIINAGPQLQGGISFNWMALGY